jgi:hypothetical protein
MWGTASGGGITVSKSAQVNIARSSFMNNTVLGDYGMGGGEWGLQAACRKYRTHCSSCKRVVGQHAALTMKVLASTAGTVLNCLIATG